MLTLLFTTFDWPDEDKNLSSDRTSGVHDLAPELSSLPEAVVAGVISKTKEDAQSDADRRERHQCHVHIR
mgnify:FL=1